MSENRKNRIYTGTSHLPLKWGASLGVPSEHRYANLVVIAGLKGDIVTMLMERGLGPGFAGDITERLHISRPPISSVPLREILAAKVVELDSAGIYLFAEYGVKGRPIVRVDPPGEFTVVGHFGTGSTDGIKEMFVIPVKEGE